MAVLEKTVVYEELIFWLQPGHLLDGEVPLTSLVLVLFCLCVFTEAMNKQVKAGLGFFFFFFLFSLFFQQSAETSWKTLLSRKK